MGLLDSSRLEWPRWWFPRGTDPLLWSGMLADPAGEHGVYLNPGASLLEDYSDNRCLVLLGEAGSGKTVELESEVARLADSDAAVVFRDLGEYSTADEVERGVFDTVSHDAAGEVTLLLDGFDEARVDIAKLSDVFARNLERVDPERVVLRIASRPALWSNRLEKRLGTIWPESFKVLVLAPLRRKDVELAAVQFGDPDAFLEEIDDLDLGVLAARPITLRLLLAIQRSRGQLPASRTDVYDQGTQSLVAEHHERRREDRLAVATIDLRHAAARHLAAYTLLCAAPEIVESRPAISVSGTIALEDVVAGADAPSIDTLRAVLDTGLLTAAASGSVRWSHRSLEEYLAARRLADLPRSASMRLLTHPQNPDRVVPQLAEAATWLAELDPEVFTWLAEREPERLLSPGLRSQPEHRRRIVGEAILSRLLGGDPPPDWLHYVGLSYPGLADELIAVIIDGTAPLWARREALVILYQNKIRDHDAALVGLIEVGADREADDEALSLAQYATLALDDFESQELAPRLAAAMAGAPSGLAGDIGQLLWPKHLRLQELVESLPADVLASEEFSVGRLSDAIAASVESGAVDDLRTALVWLTEQPSQDAYGRGTKFCSGPLVAAEHFI